MSGGPRGISALVLAGGAARRLGGSKCDLEVGGRSLLDRSLDTACAASDDVIVLPGRRELPLPAGRLADLRRVPDLPAGAGPLAALGAGLRAARHSWCLALACDQPFVDAAVVAELRAAAVSGVDAVALATDDGLAPFPALYGTHLLATIEQRLRAGRLSMRGLLDAVRVRTLPVREPGRSDPALGSLFNVNTPADLAVARAGTPR